MLNIATAVECLKLLPKPFEASKEISSLEPNIICGGLAFQGLVHISTIIHIHCREFELAKGFTKLRHQDGTLLEGEFPKELGRFVIAKGFVNICDKKSYWDEFYRVVEVCTNAECKEGYKLQPLGHFSFDPDKKFTWYQLTNKGVYFLSQADQFPGDMEVKEALKILESKTPTMEPPAIDAPAPAEATATPTGGKKKASKKQAARDVPDIEELLPHVEPFSLDSGQWVKTKDVGTPGEVTLRGCRDLKKRTGRDGLVYGVDNFGWIYCMAPKCYYYRPTMTPASRAFKKFYAGVRMTEA